MAQTVTFTRRSDAATAAGTPATFTVEIPDDTNTATAATIEDGEIRAGNSAGSTYAAAPAHTAEHIDLAHYNISRIGAAAVDSTRYRAVIGGAGSGAVRTPPNPPAPRPATPPAASLPPITPEGPDGYLEVFARGGWRGAVGEYGHSGPTAQVGAGRAFQVAPRVYIVPQVTADWINGSQTYTLPGGGDARSTFNTFGGGANVVARFVPPILSDRVSVDAGVGGSVSALTTPDSTTATGGGGQVCYDAGGGRQQCEERAGSATTDLGTTGLRDTGTGASHAARGGIAARFRVPIMVQAQIPIGSSALVLGAGTELGYTHVNPKSGSGGGMFDISALVIVGGHF